MNGFERELRRHGVSGLVAAPIRKFQVNVGYRCNLQCRHCHVEASSERTEAMDWPVMEAILEAADQVPGCPVDLTGGSPELNPHFRRLVRALWAHGHPVQVRTNLAVLLEPEMDDLPEFFRAHRVHLTASLPCYLEENVRAQRGVGVYERAVESIRLLNDLGYGLEPELVLELVYNPGGPYLPPDQGPLEAAYRTELAERFGVRFTRLLTITNMPIGRFQEDLLLLGEHDAYRSLLEAAYNPETVEGLMCRHQVCVGWDGTLYDCDFNLALGLPTGYGAPKHIETFDRCALESRWVVTGDHCFGCAAGCGSSCGGALVEDFRDEKPRAATGGV